MNPNWDLSYLYKGFDDPAFLADLKRFPEEIKVEQAILDGGDDPQTKLEKLTDQQEVLGALADRLSSFCNLTQAVDANNADATKYLNVLDVIFNDSRIVSSAVTRYIGSLANLEDLIAASPKLQKVAFHLRESAENAHHTIPEAVEPWILEMSLSGGSAFSQLRDKLDSTHTANYRGQEIPLSAVRGLAYDADASVRKDAYEAEIASYKKMELPMSYCLNAVKMEARTLSKAKGYPSVLDMTLSDSRMDRATLDAMLTAIREYLPHFRRYMKAKAKLLGHQNGLPFYDLFAPVGQNVHTYTVEEAREMLVRLMGQFTPEMGKFIDNAFEQRWIDIYPREGKTGGAFCSPVHFADRSLVMTNFTGSFSDVSTIAHELGHAWHNRCLAGLPYSLIDTPMPLAETASIFNEQLLAHMVLKDASPDEQLSLLEGNLMETNQTIVDIYSRYLFETEVIDTRADHAMSVDELKDAMLRARKRPTATGLTRRFATRTCGRARAIIIRPATTSTTSPMRSASCSPRAYSRSICKRARRLCRITAVCCAPAVRARLPTSPPAWGLMYGIPTSGAPVWRLSRGTLTSSASWLSNRKRAGGGCKSTCSFLCS